MDAREGPGRGAWITSWATPGACSGPPGAGEICATEVRLSEVHAEQDRAAEVRITLGVIAARKDDLEQAIHHGAHASERTSQVTAVAADGQP